MRSLFNLLGTLLIGGLILMGISGVAYHPFRANGWLSQGLGALWESHYEAPFMTLTLLIAGFLIFKALHSAQIGNNSKSRIPDFVMFAFIAIGIFFLGRWLTSGHI